MADTIRRKTTDSSQKKWTQIGLRSILSFILQDYEAKYVFNTVETIFPLNKALSC